ncbi:YbaN family protein [Rhizobacter sp. J219]|uniref:YbaN family protein n=1 Tax=Rhizobacter sp. J219 TaxID=2898430 RepID=UPI002150A27F|nr:YbaN family protein [Rhizobacter sp. J219]MCR5884161.1 YbaN family protein [Rhizobacter sp. J219]
MPRLHALRARSQRLLWLAAGLLSLLAGIVGIFLPLLPTTPFVLLAAFCFSRGSARLEAWLVQHPRFGPMVAAWRRNRAVPLRAKQLATVMMAVSAIGTWFVLQSPWRWAPAIVCIGVALWLWSLPTTRAAPPGHE